MENKTATQSPSPDGFKVYTSFKTLINTTDRMSDEGGVPSRVDRSYLSNLPGGEQTIFIAALKALGLIDEDSKPTAVLERMVAEPDARPEIVRELLELNYAGPLGLGARATQAQLEDEFRKFGISGSTMRRAIAFFLAAARFAEINVSPNFKLPKRGPSGSGRRGGGKTNPSTTDSADEEKKPPPPPPPMSDLPTLVQGLVEQLPKDGEEWTADKALQWLKIARLTFPFVYGFTLPPEDQKGGE